MPGATESDVAEVAWFLRGRTLYRRVLVVQPSFDGDLRIPGVGLPSGFYAGNDISVHWDGTNLIANTLGDLTKRECRYAHQSGGFPFNPHAVAGWAQLGLPTLRECSDPTWNAGGVLSAIVPASAPSLPISGPPFDAWANPHPWDDVDRQTGTLNLFPNGTRIAEDVILTDVIGFDVKVWDPGAPILDDGSVTDDPTGAGIVIVTRGAYVDLGYRDVNYATWQGSPGSPPSVFAHWGEPRSGLMRVYDTWSSHYEHDGVDEDTDGIVDEGTDGFDYDSNDANGNNLVELVEIINNGVVDDPDEMETSPPYPAPLRGIQVKIRVFDPGSRQIREVTVEQDFLPK